jgi:23S rRNA pseudouridine1911/1915/1917 synthase
MKSRGHTIFNDHRYGGDRILKGTVFNKYRQFVENCFELCPRQALHAASLSFVHPTTKERMEFNAPLPPDMQAVLDKWIAYVAYKRTVIDDE